MHFGLCQTRISHSVLFCSRELNLQVKQFNFSILQGEEFAGAPLMCQAAGEWHLVGISSWRKGCSTVAQRPRLYDRVSVNSEWARQARKTVEHLEEEEVDVKEIRRRDHHVGGRKKALNKRGRQSKKDDVEDEDELIEAEGGVGSDGDDVLRVKSSDDEVARDSRTELPAKKLKDRNS